MYIKNSVIFIFLVLSVVLFRQKDVSVTQSQYFIEDSTSTSNLHVFVIPTPQDLKNFFRFNINNQPLINSHRGGPRADFPENALETIENTLRHTWSIMEVDPRYTKDNHIVLFHDNTLDRTSTGNGKVSDHTLKELKKLKLIDPNGKVTDYAIPTLDEVLEWARGKTILFLDSKDVSVVERVKKIQEHGAQSYTVVMVSSFEDAQVVYELDPDIMMQVFMPDKEAVASFDETGIPWENVVAFVTHTHPNDEEIFHLINTRETMAVMGTSRTIDRDFINGLINKDELTSKYWDIINLGANIIEADLGIEAGEAINNIREVSKSNRQYFQILKNYK